jgi:hypothetical protein
MCRLLTLLGAGFASPFDDLQLEYPLGRFLLQNRLQLLVGRKIRSALRYRLSLMICFKVLRYVVNSTIMMVGLKAVGRPYL